jgi:hypothetical protein
MGYHNTFTQLSLDYLLICSALLPYHIPPSTFYIMSAIFPTHRLFNKNVLITGASGGIGAATGELFGFGRYAERLCLAL